MTGHQLLAIVAAGEQRLISRAGHDRTALFSVPFDKLAAAGLPPLVFDGEIAVPDVRGVTHIDPLTRAMRQIGAEGIVSKRAGGVLSRRPRPRRSQGQGQRDGPLVITGYIEREAVAVADQRDGELCRIGQVRSGGQGPMAAARPAARPPRCRTRAVGS
jgi:hypothetical protein